MKILILSCNTGQGHNTAGKAVLEELKARGADCEMRDTLLFAGDRVTKTVSGCYNNLTTKAAPVFGALYSAGEHISSARLKSPVYLANVLYRDKVYRYIQENNIDTVVMPHLFPAEVLTSIRRKYGVQLRTFVVCTDYTCIPFWEETNPDYFFLPHEDLIEEYAARGVAREKLIPTGIPVERRFRRKTGRAEACRRLGLDENKKYILIMTGSMGFGDVGTMVQRLLAEDEESHLIVLGGNNAAMKEQLREDFDATGRVTVCDFTSDVDLYMDASEMLFTKPGGLTSTEAAVKNIPLVHTQPIPGCESYNASFFRDRGMSVLCSGADDMTAAMHLALDAEEREKMRECQNGINKHACEDICDIITGIRKPYYTR